MNTVGVNCQSNIILFLILILRGVLFPVVHSFKLNLFVARSNKSIPVCFPRRIAWAGAAEQQQTGRVERSNRTNALQQTRVCRTETNRFDKCIRYDETSIKRASEMEIGFRTPFPFALWKSNRSTRGRVSDQ